MAVFEVNFYSDKLGRNVPMYVILPTDKYYFGEKKEEIEAYKTLYLLHGVIGNYTDWLYNSRIKKYAEDHDLCVVMPSGDNSMYLDQGVDYYGEFIGQEIVEFTRKSFPLSHKRCDTYIGGLSMGAFGAMRNGLKYHDTFGAIIALSGAYVLDEETLIDVKEPKFPGETMTYKKRVYGDDLSAALKSDKNPVYLIETLAKQHIDFPEIYMACGSEDFLFEKNNNVDRVLSENHIKHVYEVGPGVHDWNFWDTYIEKAINWLPLGRSTAGKSSENIGLE
ncbi:MAG TPA: acetylesterase [Erysipelotrichaceae bacterium]|nr:acetylesterase [Erysipelotrichaceae bacterium]HAV18001.1 acetylesterase [Erysipelotrichaceae bacterium]HBG84521.1 acetylesterase [Erysipelotrichaceae bacterium]HBZ50844.1 acetylesterase [Erysipelotrichaceae bacterium]